MGYRWDRDGWFGQFVSLATGVFALAFVVLGLSWLLLWRYDARVAAGDIRLPQADAPSVNVLGASVGDLPAPTDMEALKAAVGAGATGLPWDRMLMRRGVALNSLFFPVASLGDAFAVCQRLAALPPSCTPAVVPSRELYDGAGKAITPDDLSRMGVTPYRPAKSRRRMAALAGERMGGRLMWLSDRFHPGDKRLVDIVAAGDVMMGSLGIGLNPDIRPGVDAATLVGPAIAGTFREADVAFVNLEGPLYDGPQPSAKDCGRCFSFHSPTAYAAVLKSLGVDVVSLANNHSGDYGAAGRDSTMRSLRTRHIAYGGLDRDGARTAELTLKDGRTLAFTAFAPNSGTLPLNDIDAGHTLIARLKRTHDLVMVSFHGGAEGWDHVHVPGTEEFFDGEDRGNVAAFAHAAIDAGADLVVGQGPHVPRALEIYRGRLIAYSLGNFWTYDGVNSYAVSGLGPVLEAWLAPDGQVAGVALHSTRQAGLGVPHDDPLDEAARYTLYLTRSDFPGTAERLERGAQAPLVAGLDRGRRSGVPGS